MVNEVPDSLRANEGETTGLLSTTSPNQPPFRKKALAVAVSGLTVGAAGFSAMFYAAPANPFAKCAESALDAGEGFFGFLSNALMFSAVTTNSLINYLLITMLLNVCFSGKIKQEKLIWGLGLVFALFSLVPGFELNLTGFKFFGADTGNETSQTLGLDIALTTANWLPALVSAVRLLKVIRAIYIGGDSKTRQVRAMLERAAESVNQHDLTLLKQGRVGSLQLLNNDELHDSVVTLLQYYHDHRAAMPDVQGSRVLAYLVLMAAFISRIGLTLTAAFFWATRVNPLAVPLAGFTFFCSMGLATLGMDNLSKFSRLNVLSALYPVLAKTLIFVGITISLFSGTSPGAAALKGWAWLLGILDLAEKSTPCHIERDANSSQIGFMGSIVFISYAASVVISHFPLITLNLQNLALKAMKHRSPSTKEAADSAARLTDFAADLSSMESQETLRCLNAIIEGPELLEIVAEKTKISSDDLITLAAQETTDSGCKQIVDRIVQSVSLFPKKVKEGCCGRRESGNENPYEVYHGL